MFVRSPIGRAARAQLLRCSSRPARIRRSAPLPRRRGWRRRRRGRRPEPCHRLPAGRGRRGRARVQGHRARLPPRTTVAVGAAISRSASSARSARYSCTKPSSAANTTITEMTIASVSWPRIADRPAPTSRMRIRTFSNCSSSNRHRSDSGRSLELVGAVGGKAPRGLGLVQPDARGRLELRRDAIGLAGMPFCKAVRWGRRIWRAGRERSPGHHERGL